MWYTQWHFGVTTTTATTTGSKCGRGWFSAASVSSVTLQFCPARATTIKLARLPPVTRLTIPRRRVPPTKLQSLGVLPHGLYGGLRCKGESSKGLVESVEPFETGTVIKGYTHVMDWSD